MLKKVILFSSLLLTSSSVFAQQALSDTANQAQNAMDGVNNAQSAVVNQTEQAPQQAGNAAETTAAKSLNRSREALESQSTQNVNNGMDLFQGDHN